MSMNFSDSLFPSKNRPSYAAGIITKPLIADGSANIDVYHFFES